MATTLDDRQRILFMCDCGDENHLLLVQDFSESGKDPDWPYLSFSVLLNHKMPWYKRLPRAIKYLFGKETSRTWDEVLMNWEDVRDLGKVVNNFILVNRLT